MATANDIISRAGRRINILAGEEAFAAAEAVDALTLLNDMMFAFGPRGIKYSHVALAAGDTVNVPDEQIRNLVLLFADELADDYGMPISPDLRVDITRAEQQMQAAYHSTPEAKINRGLLPYRYGWFDITRGS